MRIELQGEVDINAPREKVFELLVDPDFFGKSIPDVESYSVVSPESFEAKVRVGISFIRGVITLTGRVAEKNPPTFAKLLAHGNGLGSTLNIDTAFTLEDKGGRTMMKWTAVSEASGLVTGLGEKMVRSQADKMVTRIFSSLKDGLEKAS